MIKKKYSKSGRKCRVRFKLKPKEVDGARSFDVMGDFNRWQRGATPLERRKKGGFRGEVSLESGREYRFRYLLDGERWTSDHRADGLVSNGMGDLDSLVVVDGRE